MRRRILTALVVALAIVAGTVLAELPAEKAKEAQGLIKQFEALDFKEREAATQQLIEMGPDALPLVKQTLAETKDNEVKLRCEMVAKALTEKAVKERRLKEKVVKVLDPALPQDVSVTYTDNGSTMVYEVRQGKKSHMVYKGQEEPEFDSVMHLSLSRDGEHLAYIGKRDKDWFLVHDGKESALSGMSFMQLSPDGERVGVATRNDKPLKWSLTVDGKLLQEGEFAFPMAFSPDSKHLAFTIRHGGSEYVAIDGTEGPAHRHISPMMNSGARYLAQDEDGFWLMELGWPAPGVGKPEKIVEKKMTLLGKVQEGHAPTGSAGGGITGDYERYGNLIVAGDGEKWEPGSAWLTEGRTHVAWMVEKNGKVAVVRNGKEEPPFDEIRWFVFSADDKHMAYVGYIDKTSVLMRDGKEVARAEKGQAYIGGYWLSPDGGLLAHVMGRTEQEVNKASIVCNGRSGPEFAGVQKVIFSADGKHLGYVAGKEGKSYLVLDGVISAPYSWINLPKAWDETPGKVRYIANDGGALKLMEADWPEGLDWTNGMKPIETGK